MKSAVLEKLLDRLDQIEPGQMAHFFGRVVREAGFLQKVFESLREGLLLLDGEGRISFMNGAAGRFFGLEPERAHGMRLGEAVRGLDWAVLRTAGKKSLSRDLQVFYPESRFLNFYLSQVHEEGEEEAYVMLVRDTTRSRAEAEEALESEKLSGLTLLAAGVAHEIGNPLNSLSLHLQMMERKLRRLPPGDRGPLQKHVETARGEIDRLDTILKNFLQAVRPTVPVRERVDLHEILRLTLETLRPEMEDREVRVKMDLAKNLPVLELDGAQIQQAFYNVIRNAYQSLNGREGELGMETDYTEYEVRFSVTDDGSGISPEVMGSIFEPFLTTKAAGTGLGLLIVRRILREHGGEIEVESSEGEGTRVTLFFPRTDKRVRLLELKSAGNEND